MKTIASLVFASLCVWSVVTAQTPAYLSQIENDLVAQKEMSTAQPTSLDKTNNAWFPDFKAYVGDNVRYPSVAREMGLEGVVHAEAVVKVDGDLANIRIVEGLSYSCDKEVLRLLSEMPAWNPAQRDGEPFEQRVYVRVRFQLKPF